MAKHSRVWVDKTNETNWNSYLCTRLGPRGSLCVGYHWSEKKLGIYYDYSSKGRTHESLTILNGKIEDFNGYKQRAGYPSESTGLEKPEIIKRGLRMIRNLRMIIETIPDEKVKQLLGEVSEEEWTKIMSTIPDYAMAGMFEELRSLRVK